MSGRKKSPHRVGSGRVTNDRAKRVLYCALYLSDEEITLVESADVSTEYELAFSRQPTHAERIRRLAFYAANTKHKRERCG